MRCASCAACPTCGIEQAAGLALPPACNARPVSRSKPLAPMRENAMFVFFSSRLGCLGSIAVSLVLTLLLLLLLGVF
jgi:hypothetical protein